MDKKIIDRPSVLFAFAVFIFSFLFIFYYSTEFLSSLAAAVMTAALSFAAYVIVRITLLTFKK